MNLKQLIKYTAFAAILLIAACNSKPPAPPSAPPPVNVTVVPVTLTDAVYYDEYPATVNALNQVDLRPQVSGFITGVYFKDGERVKKGQLLYSIDAQLYAANYQQAVANLAVQQANIDRTRKDANRYHDLEKNDAIAKQQVDNADAALEVAIKQADAARANIEGVQTSVRYTKVYAPFDGTIGISLVKVGTAVSAGQTLLNSVSSDKDLAVDFNVDQKNIYHFTTLLNDKNQLTDSTFSLAFGNDVYPYLGKISLLDRTVNPQTGSIKVRLIFPNTKNLLIAGMNGTVRVKNTTSSQAIIIPYKAVTEQLGEFFVYVPNDSNKVTQRKIVLGKQIGNNIIVKVGLKAGENVVVEGTQNLREGASINIITPGTSKDSSINVASKDSASKQVLQNTTPKK